MANEAKVRAESTQAVETPKTRLAGWFSLIVFLVLAGVPFMMTLEMTLIVESALVAALFALATNFLVRDAGLVSFGQGVFYGTGAYTIGLLWMHNRSPFEIGFVLAPFIAAIVALIIGALSLRAREFYFALLTLGFSQLFYSLSIQFYSFTQGDTGIFGIPLPNYLRNPVSSYEFILIVGTLGTVVLWWIRRTPFGLTLRAIRDNRVRSQALGVNVFSVQLVAFVISGFFCGLAGGLFIVYQQHAYPAMLNWEASGVPILMSVLGGMGSFIGPIVGAFIYTILQMWVGTETQHWPLFVGLIVLGFVLLYPGGASRALSQIRQLWMKRR